MDDCLSSLFSKYPTSPGVNGALPVAVDNEIAIEVDTAECQNAEWRVEVDWGAISVRSAQNYPLFFVHGWKGTPHTFDDFVGFAEEAGIYTYTANLEYGIQPMPQSVNLLIDEINKARTQYNTDRLNVFAHSRGGLFIRSALREHPELAEHINAYVTFGTPHHGTDAPLKTTDWPLHYCNPPTDLEEDDPPVSPDYEARCIEIAEQLTIAATRPYNYGDDCRYTLEWFPFIKWSWADCIPQWSEAKHLTSSYTFVGGLGEIWGRSATFPWVAWDAGEYPYPEVRRVDAYYRFHNHLSIKSAREVYDYAMNLLIAPDAPVAQAAQIEPSNNVSPLRAANAAIAPEVTEQPMYSYAGDLAANSLITFAIPLETITAIRFHVIASTTVSVTLVDPSDLLVTPLTAEANPQITYTVTTVDGGNNSYVQYQYDIESPVDGLWQVQIEAVDAAAFVFYTTIQSPVALLATTDLGVYTPGQTVLVQTGLVDDMTLQSGAVITGTLLLPDDSLLPIIFYDDGTHGDAGAGNEVYTAQLTAPVFNGRPRLLIQATKGNILRQTEIMFTVAAQTATFQQVTDEAVVDTNNNGYADKLNLAVELNVLTAGDYIISGLLADSNGTTLASATYSTIDTETPLVTGTQIVPLSFIGKTLRTASVDGPYQLKEVTVRYYDPAAYDTFTVDRDTNVYTTANYSANQFEGELVQVAGSTEAVEDINADGLYDSLKISVTLDLLLPGEYSWFGELVDANGDHVTGASGSGALNSQTPAVFTFGGWQIHNAGRNGPYRLTNVYVTKTTGQVFTEYFDDLHTTAAYQASQFGSLPLLLTNVQHQLVDRNSNGLTDRLVMSATLSAMVLDGAYNWSGRLTDPNGVEIGTTAGTSQLYDGKTLVFAFINTPLIRNSGLNGPFSLRDVTITSRETPHHHGLLPGGLHNTSLPSHPI